MATLLLTAVGTALGGPIGGALGALAGQTIDRAILFKPKGREGPRISDLRVQTSSYGSEVPAVFGTMRVAGTVIWATDLKEASSRSGGKGQPTVTSYSYSASFAVALSSRRAMGIGRIWAEGNLLRGAAGDFKTGLGAFRFHDGSEDQDVDPLIAAAVGSDQAGACRGIAYAVLEDLQLADFGNRIPSLTFELIGDDGAVSIAAICGEIDDDLTGPADIAINGYAAGGGERRAALAPLVEAFGLRLRVDGDALALDGGTVSEGVLAEALLARINGRTVTAEERSTAPAGDTPQRIALSHYDAARDYQAGVQTATRPGPGRRAVSLDLPACVDAAAARGIAETRLAEAWQQRHRIERYCGWRGLTVAPGSVVSLAEDDSRWIVAAREWEAMGVRLSLIRAIAGTPAMLPDADSGQAVVAPDLIHGPTTLMLVDLPGLSEAAAVMPQLFVAATGVEAGWRRAALFVEEPGTGALVAIGQSARRATMGHVVPPPGAASALLFDRVNSIDVALVGPAAALDDADDAALLRGDNLCLIGDELIQFGVATPIGGGAWRLSRLLRGRRGTEWAIGGHVAGEPFLLIAAETLAPVPAAQVQVGTAIRVAAIGPGDAVPAGIEILATGAALRPLAPVRLVQETDGAGGVAVRWTRRSRVGWAWRDGVDAPIGEERERYRVTLSDGDVMVRDVEVANANWTYDAAMAAADAANGHGGPLTLKVAQIGDFAVGRSISASILI